MSEGRTLPQSLEAERSVLGGLMLDPEQLREVADIVTADDFYRESNATLFRLMLEMAQTQQPVEMVAVVEEVLAKGLGDACGGLAYVSGLPDSVPSTANLAYYARVVASRAQQRRLIFAAQEIVERGYGGEDDLPDLLSGAEQALLNVTRSHQQRGGWAPVGSLVGPLCRDIVARAHAPRHAAGLSTGYHGIDRMLGGLLGSQLILLAARPAMGKTALALSLAQNVAHGGVGVGIFSMEMSKEELTTRLLCAEGRIRMGAVKNAALSRAEWGRMRAAEPRVARLPIYIEETPGLTPQQIAQRARRLVADHPDIGLLVVDYVQLEGAADNRMKREQVVSTAARELKNLAKELHRPVLALSQLNRELERRPDKRPMLADLRESGELEQAADVVVFLYRDEIYRKDTAEQGVCEVIVSKQRNGPTGKTYLLFCDDYTRFENPAVGP